MMVGAVLAVVRAAEQRLPVAQGVLVLPLDANHFVAGFDEQPRGVGAGEIGKFDDPSHVIPAPRQPVWLREKAPSYGAGA